MVKQKNKKYIVCLNQEFHNELKDFLKKTEKGSLSSAFEKGAKMWLKKEKFLEKIKNMSDDEIFNLKRKMEEKKE